MKKIIETGKQFLIFLIDIYQSKGLIWALGKQDLKQRFAGSFLGIVWAFIQPLVTILILWILFEKGFRSKPVQNVPFILWLSAGIIPFFFFQDALGMGSNSILEYRYLLNKVNFRVSVLPMVKIVAASLIHLFFIGMLVLLFLAYGFQPDLYWLQILYYLFSLIIFLMGATWMASAAVVFFRDVGQLISIVLQFWFWLTPIFYSLNLFPEQYHKILKLNPMYYIVNGYRESLIDKIWFWEHVNLTIYYWIVTLIMFAFGAIFFKKLRPHFADVV